MFADCHAELQDSLPTGLRCFVQFMFLKVYILISQSIKDTVLLSVLVWSFA